MRDIIVIGGGVIGAFVARSLSKYELDIAVLEKELDVGNVTSSANSAIAHSGYDPVPGTKKARFNVLGNRMMKGTCRELDVPFGDIGTLTIALEKDQVPTLLELQARGRENGVETHIVYQEELRKLEPNISQEAIAALLCPTGGIVNPFLLTVKAMENAVDNGVSLFLDEEVTAISKIPDGFRVNAKSGATYEARVVINAAGLHSDDIAKMVNPSIDWEIRPRKGEYYVLDHFGGGFVNHVLFPLPSKKGKGILVTPTTSGNYLVGPSSEEVPDKEDYKTDPLTLMSVREMAQTLVPSIPFEETIRVYAGLRATPSTHDFIIEEEATAKGFINVAGIESPGLVSAPAIGEYVADELVFPILQPKRKGNWNPKVRPSVRLSRLSVEERNALIEKDPSFGIMVCQCEKITKGEIEDAISRSVPCLTIKGVKRRTRAGFGKCQGGFCQPKVAKILAKKSKIPIKNVPYDKKEAPLAPYELTKGEKE